MAVELKQNMTEGRQLVRAALLGETSAFGAIVERYWNMVVALALSKIADAAEDIAQLKTHAEMCESCRDKFERCVLLQDVVRHMPFHPGHPLNKLGRRW